MSHRVDCICLTCAILREQGELAQFESWFRNCYGWPDARALPSRALQTVSGYSYSWRAWRARAII